MNEELMLSFVDQVVKIDRGGPESRIGKVLGVAGDHFTVLTEDDGVIYYNARHIKSISNNAKNGLDFGIEIPEGFRYMQAPDFKGVCSSLKHRWVKINRGGPEAIEGIMDDVNDDFMVIISNEEVVLISMYHVRNISYGVKVEKPKEEENKSKNEEKKESNDKGDKK